MPFDPYSLPDKEKLRAVIVPFIANWDMSCRADPPVVTDIIRHGFRIATSRYGDGEDSAGDTGLLYEEVDPEDQSLGLKGFYICGVAGQKESDADAIKRLAHASDMPDVAQLWRGWCQSEQTKFTMARMDIAEHMDGFLHRKM